MLEAIVASAIGAVITKMSQIISEKILYKQKIPVESLIKIDKKKAMFVLEDHHKTVRFWASEIRLRGMSTPKKVNDVFVDLSMTDDPRSQRLGKKKGKYTVKDIALKSGHFVIIGELGSGKTTMLKKVAHDAIKDFESGCSKIVPIVFRLRDIGEFENIITRLARLFGVSIRRISTENEQLDILLDAFDCDIKYFRNYLRILTISLMLEKMGALLLLDGMDEMPQNNRSKMLEELDYLGPRLKKSKILLTCRSGDFYRNPETFQVYEIENLEKEQTNKIVSLWFSSIPDTRYSAQEFMAELYKKPYKDLAGRPLALVNLCLVFEKYGQLPEMPISIYRKMLQLLLEDWDAERGVIRRTKYARFDPPRKVDFLSVFAFKLATEYKNRFTFSAKILELIYLDICDRFELPSEEALEVAKEIQSHTGIILKSSYDEYEFAHKSLQEFLVAEYISRLRDISLTINLLRKCPNELAISVALASDPTDLLLGLFRVRGLRIHPKREFLLPFLSRIVLEKPGFKNSIELGSTILWLISRCGEERTFGSKKGDVIPEDLVKNIIGVHAIKLSIKSYMDHCTVIKQEDRNKIIIRNTKTFTSKYSVVKDIELETVPKSLEQIMNWSK